jgi:hypothetical protein
LAAQRAAQIPPHSCWAVAELPTAISAEAAVAAISGLYNMGFLLIRNFTCRIKLLSENEVGCRAASRPLSATAGYSAIERLCGKFTQVTHCN